MYRGESLQFKLAMVWLLTLWSVVTVAKTHPPVAEQPTGDQDTFLTFARPPDLELKPSCLFRTLVR